MITYESHLKFKIFIVFDFMFLIEIVLNLTLFYRKKRICFKFKLIEGSSCHKIKDLKGQKIFLIDIYCSKLKVKFI